MLDINNCSKESWLYDTNITVVTDDELKFTAAAIPEKIVLDAITFMLRCLHSNASVGAVMAETQAIIHDAADKATQSAATNAKRRRFIAKTLRYGEHCISFEIRGNRTYYPDKE